LEGFLEFFLTSGAVALTFFVVLPFDSASFWKNDFGMGIN
tara:strand:- start:6055 stop:6174 length:120 start_codon:yes stop_codon:yes gene_type:complete